MSSWCAMIVVVDTSLDGIENFEAADIVEASRIALDYAVNLGGRVLRVESSDFGAFEFMR